MKKERNLFDLVDITSGTRGKPIDATIKTVSKRDIAIIGLGVKFPLANDVETFWHNLRNGVDCIRKIPDQRKKDVDAYFAFINREQKGSGPLYEKAAYLDEIDKFDYRFFGLSPKEASLMDPNQRLFLETAWAAIEDAGYGGSKLQGTRTGVYVGFGGDSEYKKLIADVEPGSLSLAVTGNLPPIIASRLSYLLDLKGPNLLVNTVCSSSLVAVDLACRGIRDSQCDLAVAGGVQTYVLPIRTAKVGIESSDFTTKPFDHNSDGTGSGEGIAAILLKPLNKAIRDRDHIYAVIKGTAVNQDGRSIGISAPNPLAQEDVITRAWKDAGIEPETISYIEAHGTGTKLGDPIEIEGIRRAFARYTERKQFCAIGSVKSNMGHLDNSAGIAGLIKAVLALTHKEIPPTLHFNRPNRKIAFHLSPVYVNDMLTPWETDGFPRRCGVSAFSFSGTNCHLVLEQAPETDEPVSEPGLEILTISAKTRDGLKQLISQYIQLSNQKTPPLSDLCFTANTGRGHYSHRLALVLNNHRDFQEKIANLDIDDFKPGNPCEGVYYGVHRLAAPGQEMPKDENREITREQVNTISQTANQKLVEFRKDSNNKNLLYQVCELYVTGAEIDWDEWYRGNRGSKPRRVSLPTYPFAARRCWLQIPVLPQEQEYYHTTSWKPEELTEKSPKPRPAAGAVLILKDKRGIGKDIARRLRQQGKTVLEAEVEAETEPARYEKLLAEPQLENLQQIIHLQTLFGDSGAESLHHLENQLQAGVYSLFYLVKALQARGNNREHIDIVTVSDYVHEVTGRETCIHPANAALSGLGKVVNMENFNFKCRTLDIDQQTGVDRIITEINAGDTSTDYKVAFRRGQRYVEELIPIDITPTRDKPVTIKPDGVYIITGGTGGLGLQIAGYLAGQNKVNLALINRTPMPGRSEWPGIKKSKKAAPLVEKINTIEEIEKKGAHVLCCCADVTRETETRETIRLLRNQFGKINGIIHCAAVGTGQAGKPVKDDDKDIFRQVMAPKVQGTWILDRLTREDQPDFFVLFSSSITLMGGMGSGSYTAGNTYLNAFASYRGKAGLRTTAICWAAWEETLKKQHANGFDKGKHLFRVQTTAEILQAFSEILTGDRNSPVVITGYLNYKSEIFYLGSRLPFRLSAELRQRVEKYQEQTSRDSAPNAGRQVSPVKLKGREDGHYQQLERQMAQVYGEFLGYPEISIYDNFYELGGDSIIAAKMVRAANQLPGVNLVVEDLLRYPTLKELANILNTKKSDKSRTNSQTPTPATGESAASRTGLDITPVEKKDYYPVSDFQEALFVLSQLRGSKSSGTANNLPSALLVESAVDGQRIGQIFQQLVDRHEALRTSFCYVGKEPVQRIHDRIAITMDNIEVEPGTDIASLIKDFVKPFDLGRAPLLKVCLVRLGPGTNRYLLLIDMHHITADGQSGVNLIKDFFDLYGKKRLTPLSIQFKDYLDWFSSPFNKPVLAIQERYWLEVFKDGVPELHMPLDRPRPWMQSFKGDSVSFESSAELKQGLNETAAKNAATLFMVLLAVLDVVLFKYTGDEDIVIGIAAAGRRRPQLEPLVGSFVNILPVRNSPGKQQTFKTLLEHVKVNLIQAFENQDYPFGQLAKKLDIAKELGRNPICDVTMALQNQQRISMEIDGLVFSPQEVGIDALDIDLNFDIKEKPNRLFFRLEYCTRLYKQETASAILTDYINALETITRDDTIPVKDIMKDKNIHRRRHEQ